MVAALGLDTKEWKDPSTAMTAEVQKLASSMSDVGTPGKGPEMQSAINDTLKEIAALADSGDKDANFAMGLFTQQSKEQGAMEKAMEYYQKAADKGQLQAMNNLGFLIAGTSKDPEKQKEGIALIKKASEAKNNPARRNMAQIYLNGLGGEAKDPAKAEQLLLLAANDKDGDAAFSLSQYYMGQGGKEKQDDKAGWDWLYKAAEYGNANALDLLGTLYFQGGKVGTMEIAKDEKKAVEKFETLANEKNPVGERKMATLLEAGAANVPHDFDKALQLYRAAAQGNDGFAQFRLASMFDTGVPKDPKDPKSGFAVAPDSATALSLYRLAAQNNLPIAAYNTGVFYEQGRAVDRDLSKAFTYYMAAAQSGVALAMQKVGDFYLNGPSPLLKDPVAAAGWYAHSADAGLPEGYLSQGFVLENGLGKDKENRYFEAAENYKNAADSAAASDQVRLAAYVRLGSLCFRGVLTKIEAKPDYDKAYIYFQQAVDLDPKNQVATQLRDEAVKKIDPSKKAALNEEIVKAKQDRDARIKKQQDTAKDAADGKTPPVAAPVTEGPSPPRLLLLSSPRRSPRRPPTSSKALQP